MLKSLSEALATAGKADNKKYYLTAAEPGRQRDIGNLEYPKMIQYLDWVNLMTYNLNGMKASVYANP